MGSAPTGDQRRGRRSAQRFPGARLLQAAARCVVAYREHMAYLAAQPLLARSYERLDLDQLHRTATQRAAKGGSSDWSACYGGNRIAEKGSWTEIGTIDKTKDKGRGRREHHRQRSSCSCLRTHASSSADTSVGDRK